MSLMSWTPTILSSPDLVPFIDVTMISFIAKSHNSLSEKVRESRPAAVVTDGYHKGRRR